MKPVSRGGEFFSFFFLSLIFFFFFPLPSFPFFLSRLVSFLTPCGVYVAHPSWDFQNKKTAPRPAGVGWLVGGGGGGGHPPVTLPPGTVMCGCVDACRTRTASRLGSLPLAGRFSSLLWSGQFIASLRFCVCVSVCLRVCSARRCCCFIPSTGLVSGCTRGTVEHALTLSIHPSPSV